MAVYRVLERSYIHDRLYEPGSSVTVADEFVPGKHLEPVDGPAKRAFGKTEFGPSPTDPDYMLKLVENSSDTKGAQSDPPKA